MCGRFTIAVNKEDLKEHLYRQFGIEDFEVDIFLPRYNVAPGEKIIAVISDGKNFRAGLMRWGFVPSFSSGFEIINARRETLSEKPSFKNSFRNKRCLILADGYYEWKKEGKQKLPYRIALKDRKLFSFAGIWNWAELSGERVPTCAIITCEAGSELRKIHGRVPIVLEQEAERLWLTQQNPEALLALTEPLDESKFHAHRVSTFVNNSRNDSEECILPIENER
ncbi:MAG: SOS response-associated peptidase [Bacilli bacterium]